MNATVKYSIFVVATIVISFFYLKPIVTHADEYKVVIVNTSEHPIVSAVITGAGTQSHKIGPIRVSEIQDYFFKPSEDGALTYTIIQNSKTMNGIINESLKRGSTGDVYVVVSELQKVRVYDEYDI